ncbi:glucosidase [Oopsacas minuta]|uniref:Glucosidase n=1 Tax=Oopsacas minuta TaxID=111878 RepID=A0AAV7JV89_9METZ|nr:glucosidase [Oopsacas minuta]
MTVVILGVLSVVLLAVGRLVLDPISNEISLPHTTFYPVSGNLVLSRGSKSIRCSLSSASADQIPPVKYDEEGGEGIHLRYNYTDSSLVLSESNRDDGVCTHIFWEATTSETLFTSLELCFSLMEGHWFGGYESYSQQWPLNYNSTQFYKPFLTTDYLGEGQEFGPVLHPAWFSSEGAAVIAETDESYLHVQLMNMSNHETRLCLGASFDGYLLSSSSTPDLHLNVTICLLDNILQANKYFLERVLGSTQNNSVNNNINIFPSPIWSTWEQYRSDVDQDNVLELLNNILSQGFNASIIQIDDTFSSKYGEIDFDTVRFPDVASMIQQIHDQNINVSVWIHPFGNINSDIFQESLSSETSEDTQNRWMFCRGDNHTLGVVRWWRGYGGLIDLTKQTTFDWLLERLTNFSNDYSIDSFKFDAGESTYLPQCDLSLHPNLYSQLYVDLASHFPSSQVQVGYDTQSYPMIVSLLDKEPTWGLNNGLHSVLTSTLTLSILGYPFVLPGSIGGSNYKRDAIANNDLGSDVLDEELFIRWVGLNAFLPFMQFSKLPWQYDDKVRDFSLEMSKLHYKLVQETMDCIGRKFTTNQEPIIRPLWWVWPMDPRTYTINTQFLIGDVYLVAPALSKGQTQCSVYLPANSGSWKDMRDSKTYSTTDESKEIQLSCTKYQTPPYFRNMASEMGCI